MWYEGLTNQAIGEADAEHTVRCWQCDCLLDAENTQTTEWDRVGLVYLCTDVRACRDRRESAADPFLGMLPSEIDW